jgi:anaerobic C4-dicarboxylate transporter
MEVLIPSTLTIGISAKRVIKLLADVLRIFVFSSYPGLVHGARMSGICDRGLV